MKRAILYFLTILLAGCCVASSEAMNNDSSVGPDTFKLIEQRNIFDPTRSGPAQSRKRNRQPVVDVFTLDGTTLAPGNHSIAIFDGYGAPSGKGLGVSEVINGYKIARIDFDSIQLQATNGSLMTLRVRTRFRREDGLPWQITAVTDDSSPPRSSSSSSSMTSRGNDSRAGFGGNSGPVMDNGGQGTGRSGGGHINPAGKAREDEILRRLKLKHQQDNQ